MNQQVLLILLIIVSRFPRNCSITVQTYLHWQCSLPTYSTVSDLIHEAHEAFQTVGTQAWMLVPRKYVSCSQRGLKSIPQRLPQDMQIVNFDQNSITQIRKDDFASYPSLVAISITDNCVPLQFQNATVPRCKTVSSIEAGAFSPLHNLSYLAISGNMMKRFPELLPKSISILLAGLLLISPLHPQDLSHLTSLEIVSFSTNCASGDLEHLCDRNFTIDFPVFSSSNLKFLDLSYDNFDKIPNFLFQHSLLGINLQGNPFKYVGSNDFITCPNITHLNLAWTSQYQNYMKPLIIEEDAFDSLVNLEVLNLSANMISNISKRLLAKNVKLKALKMEFNCLKQVIMNLTLGPLPFLEELSLAGNTFCGDSYYPMQIKTNRLDLGNAYLHFPNLTILELGMEDRIPDSHFLPSFSHYYLSYGFQYDIVDSNSLAVLRKLPRFRKLSLFGCGIRVLNTTAFAGLNLTFLDLGTNRIGELHDPRQRDHEFTDISTPVKRAYYDAMFDTIRMRLKSDLNQVSVDRVGEVKKQRLTLSYNSIADLNRYPLKYFSFATILDLSHNHINFIDANAFQTLQLLREIDLSFNLVRNIHFKTLSYLPRLSFLRLDLMEYQQDLTFKFLAHAPLNFTFQYGDTGGSIYWYLQFCRINNISFPSVTKLNISYIGIPPYFVSTNLVMFEPLPNLTNLIMNGARITYDLQPDFFNGVSKLLSLSMSNCWLEKFPFIALKKLPNLVFLDLSYNKIETLNKSQMFNFTNLQKLLLHHNFIYSISPGTLQFLQANGLHHLDLSFNQIRDIDPTIVDRNVLLGFSYFDLRGNAVRCVCTLAETFGWLVRSGIVRHANLPGFYPDCTSTLVNYWGGCITCAESDSDSALSLFTYSVNTNCEEKLLLTLALCFSFSFLSIVFFTLTFTNDGFQKHLTNLLLRHILPIVNERPKRSPSLYAYDAFICYDKDNGMVGDWVDSVLVSRLENESPQYAINVVGKEDWCGQTQVQQLLMRIQASRKTIVVFSENTLSPQCRYVLSVLEEWSYICDEDKAIVVIYGEYQPSVATDLILRRKYQNYSILHYSTTKENVLFWELLRSAMFYPM